jgi:hypothetical protein
MRRETRRAQARKTRCPADVNGTSHDTQTTDPSFRRRNEMPMTTRSFPLLAASLFLAALFASPTPAQAQPSARIDVPPVPLVLEVEAGNSVFMQGHAIGTQNYICVLTAAGTMDWTFVGPGATLFLTFNGDPVRQNATHYFSANPQEANTLRPTWQHSVDSSRVWGGPSPKMSSDPNFVEAGAIPWLLVKVAGQEVGPTGGSILTQTTFIHRLNTSGGSKPTTGCSQTNHIGDLKFVPYVADYYFYRQD